MISSLIYHCSLAVCVILASHYRNIKDVQVRKNFGAGVGMVIALLICGTYVHLSIILVGLNIIVIQYCDKRYLPSLSFTLNWAYLLYVHYKLGFHSVDIAWFHQNMVLRLVGLAFEINMSESTKADSNTKQTPNAKLPQPKMQVQINDPNPVDIIYYAYFFVGIHKGPYYKWKTFEDHFNLPFSTLGDCRIITMELLKKACMAYAAYFILAINCSTSMYYDPNFYRHSTDFMFLSNLPQLLKYVLRHHGMMYVATSVFTEAGFGLYPAKAQAIPGLGPSINVSSPAYDTATDQEYNFALLNCFDNNKLIYGPKMKDTLRGWDISIRYWFWACIYKTLTKGKKEVRSAFAFLAWSLWRGPSLSHNLTAATLWTYVNLESEYAILYPVTNSKKLPWDVGYSIMRVFCLLYLTPCIVLSDSAIILKYYNSIYWIYHVVMFFFLLVAGAAAFNRMSSSSPATVTTSAGTERS